MSCSGKACLHGRVKVHGIALHMDGRMTFSLYRKLADILYLHPHTPQVDGTVCGKSGNHISIFFRRPPHSGPPKASTVDFSMSSSRISKVSVRGKGIWGTSHRRHGSCGVLLDGHNLLDVHNRTDKEAAMFHKATGVEVQSYHNDN